jgi:uncharacterized OB-fold protein
MAIPLPKPNADTCLYWEAAAQGRLIYQHCNSCGKPQFYPRSICAACHGNQLEWRESKGDGTIATFTEVLRAPTTAFREMVPYVIALVDMDEGFRMMVNIVEGDMAGLAIGARTRTVFREVEGMTLPQGALA